MASNKYINREISWLEFNARVLDEAVDTATPLLERLKFLAIFSNNLDEFFMVRVAGVRQLVKSKVKVVSPGIETKELLKKLDRRTRSLTKRQYRYLREIRSQLSKAGIKLTNYDACDAETKARLDKYFDRELLPIVTPIAVDQSHPFPLIKNLSLHLLVDLIPEGEKEEQRAIVEVPGITSRFVKVSEKQQRIEFVTAEDIIANNLHKLFLGCKIKSCSGFRITRDMDFAVDEERVSDLLSELQIQLHNSRQRQVIRLEVSSKIRLKSKRWLLKELQVDSRDVVYPITDLMDLRGLFEICGIEGYDNLKDSPLPPLPSIHISPGQSVVEAIAENGPFLIHHPYESFYPVIKLLQEAAVDPSVLAIKQTLYRVSGKSPIVAALAKAARNGKQVTVLVELKARFDEDKNIHWARALAEAGAHVVYGIAGLKVHCKCLMIIRREENGIRRYYHLGTGNYNDSTAKLYTDLGMFGDDKNMADDISALFNVITGFSKPPSWKQLLVAPFNLREKLEFLIQREVELATKENPGHIIFKVNSVIDEGIMDYLYKAAKKNVKVDLIVRGICGVNPYFRPELADQINVVSILDRFLEHSRIYYFNNNGDQDFYVGSADVMGRNLDRRIEALFPVQRPELKDELGAVLDICLNDRRKGRRLVGENLYSRTVKSQKHEATRTQTVTYDFYRERYEQAVEDQRQELDLNVFSEPPSE